jgi:hypothetical protein
MPVLAVTAGKRYSAGQGCAPTAGGRSVGGSGRIFGGFSVSGLHRLGRTLWTFGTAYSFPSQPLRYSTEAKCSTKTPICQTTSVTQNAHALFARLGLEFDGFEAPQQLQASIPPFCHARLSGFPAALQLLDDQRTVAPYL